MSAITFLGATQTNASVAGNTSSEPAEPTAQGPTWRDTIMSGIGTEYGGLSHLFEGPIHAVDTNVDIPTQSVKGRLGGLVPIITGLMNSPAPGPGTQPGSPVPGGPPERVPAAPPEQVPAAPPPSTVPFRVGTWWSSVRKRFGF